MLAITVESGAGGKEIAEGWGRPRSWVIRPEVVCGGGQIGTGLVAFRWVAWRISGSAGRALIRGRLSLTGICFTNTGSHELVIGLEGSDRGSKATGRRASGREREKTCGRLSRRGSLGCSGWEHSR